MATLLGLDFGSTTSSAVIASAQLRQNAITGRMELTGICETFRSELVFTPLIHDRLDEAAIDRMVDGWLAVGSVDRNDVIGGGALLTGLTAARANAAAILRIVRSRLGDALVATADDPCLESWLAFLGSCAGLSQRHPDRLFLHLDVGGGTTNFAFGRQGEVQATGCLFVAARHIRVEPGTYRIVGLSRLARRLLAALQIEKTVGQELEREEVRAVVEFQIGLLEAVYRGESAALEVPLAESHIQVFPHRFFATLPALRPQSVPVVTLSGGVGELVYRELNGSPSPSTTAFGDLGIDLAKAIVNLPNWQSDLVQYVPTAGGRATVYGLLRHSTQLSGNTIHLTEESLLPLRDIPILGSILPGSTNEQIRELLELAKRSRCGAALRIELPDTSVAGVRHAGERLGQFLTELSVPVDLPLVLLLRQNAGKTLGQYVSHWGKRPLRLLVVDEIDLREASFVHLGELHDNTIPVSFFGLRS